MQHSCGAVPSPSEEFRMVTSSSTAVVGMALGKPTEDFVTTSAASDKSAAPTDSNFGAERPATDNTVAVATGSAGLIALGAAQHPALENAPEETSAELAPPTVLREQNGREAVEAARIMSTTADLRSAVSYWLEDSASLSTPGDTEVQDTTGVYCKNSCIQRQPRAGSYLPGPSRLFQATAAAAEGSGGFHFHSAIDLQQGPLYSGALDTDRSFYSRSSRWSSIEKVECIRGSKSTSLLGETFARPHHQVRVLDEDESHARSGAGSNDCDRIYRGKCETACTPASYCSGPCACSGGAVHARYSHSGETRRLLCSFACGNEAAVDEVSRVHRALAEANLQGVDGYSVDPRDDNRKNSLLGGKEPLQRQAAQQPARQGEPESMEKGGLVEGRSVDPLQAYECLHQQPQMEQRLHQQGEQQGSWHLRISEWPRAAVGFPHLEASCSARPGEKHVADSVRQQTGMFPWAEEQARGEEAGLLRAANCYSRRGGARTYMPAHSSCAVALPQPSGAEGAARCYCGGPHGKQPLLSGTVDRNKHVLRATSVSRALHRTQRAGDGAFPCADVSFSCGCSRRLHIASSRYPAVATTHGERPPPRAAPASAVAVCPPDVQSYSAETSACPYGGVWEQEKHSTYKDASDTNRGAHADVCRPLKEESHLATIVPDSVVAVAPTTPVVGDFRERPGVAPASVSSFAVPIDSSLGTWEKEQRHLYPQEIPQQLVRHHQHSQGVFHQKVHQHLQIQQQQLQQQLQPEGRLPLVRSGFMQQDIETTHPRKQAPASDYAVSAVSLDRVGGGAGEVGRQWLVGASGGDTSVAANSGTGTLDAAEVRGRQEVAPLSFACLIEESVSFSSLSGCSTPVNADLSEEEAQHVDGEGVETVPSRQQTGLCSQYQALQGESFTQQQVGSSRHHHEGGLLQPKRRQELVCQQQELQQQNSSVPYTYVEGGLSGSESKTGSVPVETTTRCNSGTPSVEAGEHESWRSAVESACYTVGSRYTSESSACYSYARTTEAEQKPAGPEERSLCKGRTNTAYTGHCRRATRGGEKWSCFLCPPTQVRSPAVGAAADLSSRAAGGASSYSEAGRPPAIPCSYALVQPQVASADMTLCLPSGVLPFPVQFLHTVGVVGAAAPAVTEVNDAEEGSAGGGRKELAPGEQRVSPRRVGRSHSVLKRAASADPASGRFAKVKTVSFADLNECGSSVVGRSTSSLQDIDPTVAPSASPRVCLSSSGRDAVVAKEIGKSSAGGAVERPGGGEAAAARRAGGGPAEGVGADVGIEMQKVRAGARQAAPADAARKGRRRQEDGREEAGKAESSLGRRLRTSLVSALAVLTRRGPSDGAVAAAADRDGGGRPTVDARAEVAPRGLQTRSSNSLSSERVSTRRGGGITPGGRDRQEIQSGSSSNNGGGEEIGGSGEGEGREGGWRRRRRVSNKRRRRRVSGGNGSGTDRNRGTRSPGARAGRSQRRSRSAESTPSSDSIVAKASSRLTRVLANIFRAFQNLTEHDTVFGMREELLRRDSAPLSRGGATESEIAVAVSPLAGTAAGGSSSSVGGGGGTTAGGVHQGLAGAESPGGGGGEGSVSRSVSSDVLLRRLPLKFVDRDLEDLFAGNINQWMTTRLLLMGVLMLVVTSLMWPLMAWSFNLQDAFDHSEPIGVLFHVDMSLNVIISLLFIVTRFSDVLTNHAELIGDAGTFVVITIWGIWNTVASFVLERSYVRDVIQPQMVAGQQSYVSLDKTTSWSSAQEASSAVAYLYGLLLIVQLDVVYPSRNDIDVHSMRNCGKVLIKDERTLGSVCYLAGLLYVRDAACRTRRTWQIHLMFFLLSSSSIIVRGAINPNFVPVPFVVIRVATYLMLTIFLYIGRHATELQQRHTFYNWLMTRKRMDRLESDLKRQKESGKVSTAVEQLVDLIKQCKDIFHSLETGVADISPFHRMQLDECNRTLDRCLSILTNTTNLYTVQFGELDSDTHREIIQAFLNTHNSSPADWTRVAREAFTRTSESRPYTSTPSRYAFRPPPGISDLIGRDVIVDVHPPAEAPNGTAEQRRSTNSHDTSDAGYSPLSSKGSAFEVQTDNAVLSSPSTAGVGATVIGTTGAPVAVRASTSAAAATSTSGTTTEGSKALAQDPHGDPVFKFVYSSPRGVDFSDGEVVLLQVPRKKTRVLEDRGPHAPDGCEVVSEYDESRLRTNVAADELESGAPESKHGTSMFCSAETSPVAVRDTVRRSKWTSSGWTGHVREDAAAEDAARTVTSGYGSPVSGSRLEDTSSKQREGKLFPENQACSLSERHGEATGMAAGEPAPTSAAGSLAGRLAGRVPAEERERQAAVAQRDEEAASVNRVQGRRLSSAVAPEESEDGSGVASGARTAQEKRLLTPEGVVPRAAAELSRSSATASTASRKRSSVAGELVYRAFVMDQRACKEMKARNEAVAKILILSPGSPELNLVQRLSEEEVQSWDFDCLMYAKESPAPLVEVGYALLARPCENLMLPRKERLVRFLKAVEAQYNAVPYHNSIHGFMVSQKMVALTHLLKLTSKINSRDLAVLVVAGLCHDIGHPGRNNALLINAIDPVAVLYNDKSVLENYHACLTFKTLDLPDCDLFSALRSKIRREYHVVRSLIIELILATDMKNHFETVSRFRIRRLAADFDTSGEEDLWFLLKIVIKCADLSHCGVSWSEHFEWCLRLCTEFYDQGDEELARHLPVSPLCEREKHAEIAKSQLGFMNFVTIPLYEELVAVDSTGDVEYVTPISPSDS